MGRCARNEGDKGKPKILETTVFWRRKRMGDGTWGYVSRGQRRGWINKNSKPGSASQTWEGYGVPKVLQRRETGDTVIWIAPNGGLSRNALCPSPSPGHDSFLFFKQTRIRHEVAQP